MLGSDRPRPAAGLYRGQRGRGLGRFEEFAESGEPYPAIKRLWENAWSEFVPFLDYDVEIRKIICSTNAIESLNARYRRAVRVRGHFPNEQAALKCLYLTTRSTRPHRQRQGTMGNKVEAGPERIRYHVPRPHPNKMITDQIRSTVLPTDPRRSNVTAHRS